MSSVFPNRFYICNGHKLTVEFGDIRGPIHPIAGLHPHLLVNFTGGVHAHFSPALATALARQLPEALTALTALRGYPGCSGTVWGGEE